MNKGPQANEATFLLSKARQRNCADSMEIGWRLYDPRCPLWCQPVTELHGNERGIDRPAM